MIKPLSDYVVIEPLKEEKKKGGIILPDTVDKEKAEQGKVVAVGPGRIDPEGRKVPVQVKKGDMVVFHGWPNKVKIDEKEYLIVREGDIMAILD